MKKKQGKNKKDRFYEVKASADSINHVNESQVHRS